MSGLVGWWPLHEVSGSTAHDLSGNENHGTIDYENETDTNVAGIGGLPARRYSYNARVELPNLGDVFTGGGAWCVAFWMIRDEITTDNGIINFRDGQYGPYHVNSNDESDERPRFRTYDGTTSYTCIDSNPPVNEWVHYVFQATGPAGSGGLELYKNGSLESTNASWDISSDTGSNHTMLRIIGSMVDLRVYRRSLPADEVQTLYEWGGANLARPPVDGVNYWPFDDDSDTSTATDEWGTYDGTIYGAVYTSDSIRGNALEFDGTDDYVHVSTAPPLTDAISVFSWAKPQSTKHQRVWNFRQNSGADSLIRFESDGTLRMRVCNEAGDQYQLMGSEYIVDAWQFVGFTWDASTEIRGYRNAVDITADMALTDQGVTQIQPDEQGFYLGSTDGTGNFWNGMLDDIRIYDRALEPWEISQLYQWGTRGRDMRKLTVNAR